ncbi:winged helix DNA-binding protein [Candidatus Woesearchaeota archaeon]|nr:winged helix DNA-binding protein [Candidatus Woesearchaeota archaeon]
MVVLRKISKGFKIFLREKPVELLLCLTRGTTEKYPSMLAKESKCTYSHTVHLLQRMEKAGLVKFEKKGRLKLVSLTKKGQEIADRFEELAKRLNK